MRWTWARQACAVSAVLAAGLAFAAEVPTDRIIVRLKGGAPAQAYDAAQRQALAGRISQLSGEALELVRVMGDGAQVMSLPRRLPPQAIRARFAPLQDPDVLEIVPDRLFFPALVPNDAQYVNQWYLDATNGINAPAAWDLTTGSAGVTIGIIDTGKLPHVELASRWVGGHDFVSLGARERRNARTG
jgi:serine protease